MQKHNVVSIDELELWENAEFQGIKFEFNVGSGIYCAREIRCDAAHSIYVINIRSKAYDINRNIKSNTSLGDE